ncbi:ferritin family protein [Chloroflexota bacterium]
MPQAYCLKCRKMVEIQDPRRVTLKNMSSALVGTCPISKNKVYRLTGPHVDPVYVLTLAIEREKEANRFYLQSAKMTSDPDGKKMFSWLAEEEVKHWNHLDQQLKSLRREAGWVPFPDASTAIVRSEFPKASEISEPYEPEAGELEALRQAISSEKKSVGFYKQNERIMADPGDKQIFASLVKQEQGHLELLQAQMERLKRKQRYFSIHKLLHLRP